MRSKRKSVKARTCAKTETVTQEAEASEPASARSQEAPQSHVKGDANPQTGHTALQALPSNRLPNATRDIAPQLTEPSSGKDDSLLHQEVSSKGPSQQQTGTEPASASATPLMPPQQGDKHLVASREKATAALHKHQCSAAPQGNVTMAQPMPASTPAAGGGLDSASSSAQQAEAVPAANSPPPQHTASASAAEEPGACALHVSATCPVWTPHPCSAITLCCCYNDTRQQIHSMTTTYEHRGNVIGNSIGDNNR